MLSNEFLFLAQVWLCGSQVQQIHLDADGHREIGPRGCTCAQGTFRSPKSDESSSRGPGNRQTLLGGNTCLWNEHAASKGREARTSLDSFLCLAQVNVSARNLVFIGGKFNPDVATLRLLAGKGVLRSGESGDPEFVALLEAHRAEQQSRVERVPAQGLTRSQVVLLGLVHHLFQSCP